jgi:hypothetical protein
MAPVTRQKAALFTLLLLALAGLLLTDPGCAWAMPGVPRPGTQERSAWDVSFSAGVYSGFCYSIPTALIIGLVVGLAVWGVGVVTERRRTAATQDRELASFRERLRAALAQPARFVVFGEAKETDPVGRGVPELLAGQPIGLWYENLPQRRQFLDAVRAFQASHQEFLAAAQLLIDLLRQCVRLDHSKRRTEAPNDPPHVYYSFARIRGQSPEQILPWLVLLYPRPPRT